MPLYEYQCNDCGKTFEVIQKFSDEPLTVHPECGGAVRRLLSSPALQFKGTGWYITDYAKSGSGGKGGAKANGGSESKTESSSPSTESKPAATNTSGSGSSTSGSSSSSSGSSSTGSK